MSTTTLCITIQEQNTSMVSRRNLETHFHLMGLRVLVSRSVYVSSDLPLPSGWLRETLSTLPSDPILAEETFADHGCGQNKWAEWRKAKEKSWFVHIIICSSLLPPCCPVPFSAVHTCSANAAFPIPSPWQSESDFQV